MKKIFKFIIFLVIFAILSYYVLINVYKTNYIDIIDEESKQNNVDKYHILSIIKAESNFKPDAVSAKNAIGLMQLTLDTAKWCAGQLGIEDIEISDLYVPEINIKLGTYYFSYLMSRYNDFDTAISAYNAGMGNVDKWLDDSEYSIDGNKIKNTPFDETNRYVTKINNNLKIYKFLYKEL